MPHPIPTSPTNVETNNPYVGLDRGLFLSREAAGFHYLRIHSARWLTAGPLSALGRLEFQLMSYPSMPTSLQQLTDGELVQAPDGGYWFDTLTRGAVETPIMAEYWASSSYFEHYSQNGALLSAVEKTAVDTQAQQMTALSGGFIDLVSTAYQVTFSTVGGPLSRQGSQLTIQQGGDTPATFVLTDPTEVTDPVLYAIQYLKALQGV